ncbi:MAG: class I SAM-dependent RNA methyltransferase [Anaerolineae bacterium]
MSNETFEVEIVAMANGGSGIARHNGRTVFIPQVIPGERVEARITQDKGKVLFAEGVRLLEASADRVFPRCAHFGKACCAAWQHIEYQAQLLLKQDVLADQLGRIGELSDEQVERVLRPVMASPQEWGYNHHMTLQAAGNDMGLAAADGRVLPLRECHLLHPELWALYQSFDLELEGLKRLKLQIGSNGAHMLILTMANDEAPELETDMATSVNMLLEDNEPMNLIGDSHSLYVVGERRFRVTAGSFFRANVSQLENLVGVVLDGLALTGSETVLDLYAGVGLFSAFIAPQASLVTLVESYPPAVTDADENLQDFEHIDIIEGSVEEALDELDERYDAALLDPPGSGLSVDVIDLLSEHQIPRLVYVSSDPATLARDAKRLAKQGYTLKNVQPIDLAPQTYYVDSVAVFER